MNDNILIRPASITDANLLKTIGIETYRFTFAPVNTQEDMDIYLGEAFNDEIIKSEIEEPNSAYFIAFDNETPAGYARVRVNHEVAKELGKNAIEVHRLYAMPNYLGKGVGKLLMQRCFDHAVARKADWIWLGVWEKNFTAQKFYSRWGFEKFGEHEFMMGKDMQTDWLLRKKLRI